MSPGRRSAGKKRAARGTALQRRTRRRRTWRTVVVLVAVAAVLLAGAWLVGFSSVLAVRQVAVDGTQVLDVDEVRSTAAVPIGQPLARIDTDGVTERVGTLTPVRSVQVSRAWPNTVRIEVTERTALFVNQQGNTVTAVDESGIGFTTLEQPPDEMIVGHEVPEELWADVATVIQALPDQVSERARTVTAKGPDGIVIGLDEGVNVEWGSAEDSADKALVLSALMTAAPDAKVYNVTAPKHPTTR